MDHELCSSPPYPAGSEASATRHGRVGIAAELINANAGPPTYRSVACTHRGADQARFHRAGQRGRSGSDVAGFESANGLRRAEAAAAEEDRDQWRRIASSKCVWRWSREVAAVIVACNEMLQMAQFGRTIRGTSNIEDGPETNLERVIAKIDFGRYS